MTPVQLLAGDGQSEPREAEQQRTQRELAFPLLEGDARKIAGSAPADGVWRLRYVCVPGRGPTEGLLAGFGIRSP